MSKEKVKCTPLDYSDSTLEVYFEVADKPLSFETLGKLDYIGEVLETELGFKVRICIQQIPDVVLAFSKMNIAIYGVLPDKDTYEESDK